MTSTADTRRTADLADGWRLALGTLTALRVRPPATVTRRSACYAMAFAPLTAVPAAIVMIAVAYAATAIDLPTLGCGVILVAVSALMTRALHLDGLSDTADGLSASYDPVRSLTVMKSGTAGPSGVVALIIVLGLQVAGLSALADSADGAILAGGAFIASRASLAVCCCRGVPSARPTGLGSVFAGCVPKPLVAAIVVAATGVVTAAAVHAGLEVWRGPSAVIGGLIPVLLLLSRTRKRFGGVTGDVMGACVEVAFATTVVLLA